MAGWCRAAGAYRPRQAPSVSNAGFGLGQRCRCADMHPVPVEPHAVEASFGKRPVPEKVQREFAVRCALEQPRIAERHAGKGEGHDLTLASALQPPVRRHGEIALAAIADARIERSEQKQGVHDLRVPQFQHAHERRARAFAPHRVGILDEEGTRAEQGSARLAPPPVSSSTPRSSETRIAGFVPSRRARFSSRRSGR